MSDLDKRSKVGPGPEPVPESVTLRRPAASASPDDGETDTLPSPAAGSLGEAELPTRGRTLAGRYTVLDLIGQGGMGVVLAAYDSRLDRRVALKLLRAHTDSSADSAAEKRRLLREAQSMARLNHPHVVAVYDSGQLEDGSVFLAMEYVKGQTLRQWRRERPRSWREVLQAYVQAGRGLAAAHAAGLIHRDFKPDNVLMGRDGEVKVTDFGLARAEGAEDSMSMSVSGIPLQRLLGKLDSPLTLPGTVMGTPAYMAPELLQGMQADARSDLYAFCVSLHEALYEQLPFPTSSMAELTQAQAQGRVTPPPAPSEVPAGVARTVLRGLQAERLKRPASMAELLAALDDGPDVRRKMRVRAAVLTCSMLILGGTAAWGWFHQQGPRCNGIENRLAGVWDGAVREGVTKAFVDTGLPYARDTAARVSAALTAYSGRWVELSKQVCEATREQGTQPRSLLVLQEYCLERRRSQLQALTDLLSRGPDKDLVGRATQAAQSLLPLEYCTDTKALTAAVPPPEDPTLRARAEELQLRVDRLEALYGAGKYKEGLEQGEALFEQVRQLDFPPLQASTLYWVARLRDKNGDYKGAEALMREVVPLASQGKDDVLVVRAWAQILLLVGVRQARYPEAMSLELTLQSAVKRSGDERAAAESLHILGNLYFSMGEHEQARTYLERALELRQKLLGPRHPEVASSLNALSGVLYAMGDYPQARVLTERTLALRRELLGAEHPEVASTLGNLANVLDSLGEYEQARQQMEEALILRQKLLGAEDPQFSSLLSNLAQTLCSLGQYEQAQTHLERALELQQKLLGAEHPTVASSFVILGQVLWKRGRYEEAHERLERALALLEKGLSPQHPSVAFALDSLGGVLSSQGRHAQARARQERALALLEKQTGPEQASLAPLLRNLGRTLVRLKRWELAQRNLERALTLQNRDPKLTRPDLVETLLGLGELHLAQGSPAEAVPLLERALAPAPAAIHAQVQFTLAQALWDSAGNRTRARGLAVQAREYYQRIGHTPGLNEVSSWLASHSQP
jgi:eukaryotic-like serine/threonine-protein kinase